MRVKLQGRRWRIYWAKNLRNCGYYGLCIRNQRLIEIDAGLKGRKLLDTLIHEMIHARLPKLKEKTVAHMATDIARVLTTVAKKGLK